MLSCSSLFVDPDHSAEGGLLRLLEYVKFDGFGTGEIGLVGSPGRGGAGLNGWATGLVVCPVFNLEILKDVEAGREELVVTGLGFLEVSGVGGFGELGRSGLYAVIRVDSGRGLG